jgi:DNA-binding CsgD family transcriptional regulator/GTPase SAR1 family protein
MELLERDTYLEILNKHYQNVLKGNGHTVFLMGDAGIGKTSLLNEFIKSVSQTSNVFIGFCDSLFTPRPLGPLFDIAPLVDSTFAGLLRIEKDRSVIFSTLLHKISALTKPVILIFEDVHWADEATIDLIKFLSKRIEYNNCLFIVTSRINEMNRTHPLTTVFGELQSQKFSKIIVEAFSKQMVDQLAKKKGYAATDQLYALTGGNPFYVSEILANPSTEIPERIKDSILSVYYSTNEDTRLLLNFFSILSSSRIEMSLARKIEDDYSGSIDECILSGIIISRGGYLSFKHELFRISIEESIPYFTRRSLHHKMLDIMNQNSSWSNNLSQLVHHARFADDRELVTRLAPRAAQEAASLGAHIEASKLYLTAIEFTESEDPLIVELYEHHAYECYLTNQIPLAITSQNKALVIWRNRKVTLKIGDAMRFLSRLYWFHGEKTKAMDLALESIKILDYGFPTRQLALAYSNLSQLYMLEDDFVNTLHWGQKAIDLAARMNDLEILSHALNNTGSMLWKISGREEEGVEKLYESLSIALKNDFQEHVARAYTNLINLFVLSRQYKKAAEIFELGIKYCDDHDLNSWGFYIMSCKAQLLLETGQFEKSRMIVETLQNNPNVPVRIITMVTLAKINIRYGNFSDARKLIAEAKALALPLGEVQRTVPVLMAQLELCWISRDTVPLEEITSAIKLFHEKNNSWYYSELVYWTNKCGIEINSDVNIQFTRPYKLEFEGKSKEAAELWKELGSVYKCSLAYFETDDEELQKQALIDLYELGATATREMLKLKLKDKGVKNIPRHPHESTRNNPAQLTNRQIDVLMLLEKGLQNNEIGEKLFISSKTVENHITSIFSKLDVNTRGNAIEVAKRLGILK